MKISELSVGTIVYVGVVFLDKSKPNFYIDKYIVVLPEHNILRMFDYKGELSDKTIQHNNTEVFLSEKDAYLHVSKILQENLDSIKELYESKIEEVLKKAVTKIEEAV